MIDVREYVWYDGKAEMSTFSKHTRVIRINTDKQTDSCAHKKVNNPKQSHNLHQFIIIAISNMKAASNSNRRYFFGDYLTRPKSGNKSNSSSSRRKKMGMDERNGLNINQTFKEYFPQSDSNGNNSSTFSNILSPANRNYTRHSGSNRSSNDQTVNSTQKSTRMLFEKQISRLTTQLQNKEKQLFKNKAIKAQKVKEKNELVQLYRIINFYEGKARKLQEQLSKYETTLHKIGKQCDQKSQHKTQVEQLVLLFEDMRKDNEKLSGTIEEKDYQMGRLKDKIKKMEFKNSLFGKKPTLKKKISGGSNGSLSREKSQISQRTFKSATNLLAKKDMYGNIYSKINTIESSLNFLKKQNDKLNEEVEEKDKRIEVLEKQIEQLRDRLIFNAQNDLQRKSKIKQSKEGSRISLRNKALKGQQSFLENRQSSSSLVTKSYKKQDPLNQVVILPQKVLKEIKKPDVGDIPVSEKSSKPHDKYPQLTKQIRHDILRRIKYQLITEQVSYEDLIDFFAGDQNQAEVFQEYPYNLASEESEWLCEWLENVKDTINRGQNGEEEVKNYLKTVIPRYEAVSLRAQNNLKIQIYNCYLNRQQEFIREMKKSGGKNRKFEQILEYFQNWPLTHRHLDIIGKNLYEDSGNIVEQSLETVQKMLLKWGNH